MDNKPIEENESILINDRGTKFYILDRIKETNDYLLRRNDGTVIIAYGWDEKTKSWARGNYYTPHNYGGEDHNIEALCDAANAFKEYKKAFIESDRWKWLEKYLRNKDGSNPVLTRMTYPELRNVLREKNLTSQKLDIPGMADHYTGYVIISEDSFTAPYSLAERTYKFSNNNKAFIPGAAGYSIYAESLEGDDYVRLEQYISYGSGWKIEDCFLQIPDADTLKDPFIAAEFTPERKEFSSQNDSIGLTKDGRLYYCADARDKNGILLWSEYCEGPNNNYTAERFLSRFCAHCFKQNKEVLSGKVIQELGFRITEAGTLERNDIPEIKPKNRNSKSEILVMEGKDDEYDQV